jgi:DNA-binding NarL/FixJ family response regulator
VSRLHVIICDTHRTMREALAGYLCSQPEVASARVAGNADDAIRLARQGGDVLILDLMLGAGSTGLDVLEALGNLGVSIPVLVISGSDTLDDVARALSLGALGFCHKSVRPQTLYQATLQVASGQAVIPDVAVARC